MMRFLLFTLLALTGLSASSQEIQRNLDFEQLDYRHMPIGWTVQNVSYKISLDTETSNTGKTSVLIALDSEAEKEGAGLVNSGIVYKDFRAYKTVTIIGYIRTDNLTNGTASLWMEHRSNTAIIAGVNSDAVSKEGSTNWERHTITLPIDPEAKHISFGCKMTGFGKAWFDSFEIIMDDKVSMAKVNQ